ncbi:MAG TPA: DUF1592 domain-containing protein [Polyangia bacterium]|jgi:hypothetical protein|nr:DUF1592 domain-containing protein [Polyangia bacterium]
MVDLAAREICWRWTVSLVMALAVGAAACGRSPTLDGGAGEEPGVDAPPSNAVDPGWSPLRRLDNLEYDLTVRDLLGVDARARLTFQPDETAGDFGFADFAGVQSFSDSRYEQYANTAWNLADEVFADPALRARIITCAPAAPGDEACTRQIVTAFGLRAWRRPLASDEVDGLVALAAGALADGATFEDAIERVVVALLSSAPFLFHLEFDPDPSSPKPHPLAPYELASRLSYLLWSSMPDDRLFGLAADGTLARDEVLRAEVGRMIVDPRADGFIAGFAGPWLGDDDLAEHPIDPSTTSMFDPALIVAMSQELRLYFAEFLRGRASFATFLDADVNFVNARLARHYGMDATGLGDALRRIVDTGDQRAGFLGLGAMLTVTSARGRSSPTERGKWILEHLLCVKVPFGPPDTPDSIGAFDSEPLRQLIASIDGQPACGACHRPMDSVGQALEGFDQIGAFRTQYPDGRPVDTQAVLPDGTRVDSEPALAAHLADDPNFLPCVSRTALTYALGRDLGDLDRPALTRILDGWTAGTPTLRGLLEEIIVNDVFRTRRREGAP